MIQEFELDLTSAKIGMRVQIPAPSVAPATQPGQKIAPRYWPVATQDGELLGHLRLKQNILRLMVFSAGAGTGSWLSCRFPPTIDLEELRASPDGRIVIGSNDPISNSAEGSIYVRATILLDDPLPKSDAPLPLDPTGIGTDIPNRSSKPPIQSPKSFNGARVTTSIPKRLLGLAPQQHESSISSSDLLVSLDAVAAREIEWIVPGLVPAGKITLIAGEPGLGKSMLMADIAASVSSGRAWGPDAIEPAVGGVVIVSLEDDASDTLKPRLLAAGASAERIHVVRDKHMVITPASIVEAVEDRPDVKLLIIDPVSGCLGGNDMNSVGAMRRILMPLAAWAEKRAIGIILVTHLNKAGRKSPLERILGSQAISAVARVVLLVCKDPTNPHRQLLLPLKDNIGAMGRGIAFFVEAVTLPDTVTSARVMFDTEEINITPAQALAAAQTASINTSALAEAERFLSEFLQSGVQSAVAVKAAAEAHSISAASIRRARVALGIKPSKDGMTGGWTWALSQREATVIEPTDCSEGAQKAEGARSSTMSTFG